MTQADIWGKKKKFYVSLCEKEGWYKEMSGGMEALRRPYYTLKWYRLVIFINKSSPSPFPRIFSSVPVFLFFFPHFSKLNLKCVSRKHELLKHPIHKPHRSSPKKTKACIPTLCMCVCVGGRCRELDKEWERRDEEHKNEQDKLLDNMTHQGDGNGKTNSDSLLEKKKTPTTPD